MSETKASTTRKPAARRKAASPGNKKTANEIGPEQWHAMVSEAAYYQAEARNFRENRELEDWLEAEAALSRLHRLQ